jgi:hypothetical protein
MASTRLGCGERGTWPRVGRRGGTALRQQQASDVIEILLGEVVFTE